MRAGGGGGRRMAQEDFGGNHLFLTTHSFLFCIQADRAFGINFGKLIVGNEEISIMVLDV